MKDSKGHGSNGKGGTGTQGMRLIKTHTMGAHSAKVYNNPEWGEKVVKFFQNGTYQSKADYHTDDVGDAHDTAKAGLSRYNALDNSTAAKTISPASAAPTHSAMSNNFGANAKRISDAEGAMSRLATTFKQGDNRHGEYGRNVREAFDRHAKTHAELTGKKQRSIYD